MNHLVSSTASLGSSEIKMKPRRRGKSSSDSLIHCRKIQSHKEEQGTGDRGRKLSQHTWSSPPQNRLPDHCPGLYAPSHLNALSLWDSLLVASACSALLYPIGFVVGVVAREQERE